MEFSATVEQCLGALNRVSKANGKGTLHAMADCVLMVLDDQGIVTLSAFNGVLGMTTTMNVLPVDSKKRWVQVPGGIVIPTAQLQVLLKSFESDMIVNIKTNDSNWIMSVHIGIGHYRINGFSSTLFDPVRRPVAIDLGVIDGIPLRQAINQVAWASDSKSVALAEAVYLEWDDKGMRLTCMCGNRMGHVRLPHLKRDDRHAIMVQAPALRDALRIIDSDVDAHITLTDGSHHLQIELGNTLISIRTMHGDYFPYWQLLTIKDQSIGAITVQHDALLKMLQRLIPFTLTEKQNRAVIDVDISGVPPMFHIRAVAGDVGGAEDAVQIEAISGDHRPVILSAVQFSDALKHIASDRIVISYGDSEKSPLFFHGEGDENLTSMIISYQGE